MAAGAVTAGPTTSTRSRLPRLAPGLRAGAETARLPTKKATTPAYQLASEAGRRRSPAAVAHRQEPPTEARRAAQMANTAQPAEGLGGAVVDGAQEHGSRRHPHPRDPQRGGPSRVVRGQGPLHEVGRQQVGRHTHEGQPEPHEQGVGADDAQQPDQRGGDDPGQVRDEQRPTLRVVQQARLVAARLEERVRGEPEAPEAVPQVVRGEPGTVVPRPRAAATSGPPRARRRQVRAERRRTSGSNGPAPLRAGQAARHTDRTHRSGKVRYGPGVAGPPAQEHPMTRPVRVPAALCGALALALVSPSPSPRRRRRRRRRPRQRPQRRPPTSRTTGTPRSSLTR